MIRVLGEPIERVPSVTPKAALPKSVTNIRGRGRPRKPDALSAAAKQKAYRERRKAK